MNFKDLNIKPCYESGVDDIIEDYYVPVLGVSIQYDRIAGFFSSTSLAVAARGVADFITNGGKMRLITSPRLNGEDIEIVKKIVENDTALNVSDFGIDLNNLEDEFEKNHVKALGWMLATGLLEMKLAIVFNEDGTICDNETITEKGLFHQKVGVLTDADGNEMSFSGSINETASAWVNNDEEFKVFKAWTDSYDYFIRDKKRFDEIWNGRRRNIKLYNLPKAVCDNLIHYSKDFDRESISLTQYRKKKKSSNSPKNNQISLFDYQEKAIRKWKDNSYQLLFEMATGTGKTRTAIAGISMIKNMASKSVTIVSTPQNTLSKQWKEELEKFDLGFDASVIIDGTVTRWNALLSKLLLDNAVGLANHIVIFTTHATASSEKFIATITSDLSITSKSIFVGDEVHWLGARKYSRALLPQYEYRIGLSATPSRWFDDDGTLFLSNYFGNDNFIFSIHDALTKTNPLTGKHFLVNYYYYISSVSLNEIETSEYRKVSQQLLWIQSKIKTEKEAQERYDRLLEKRANIIKNAEAKYAELERILDVLDTKGELSNLIIFVSPEQIERVMQILFDRNIMFHKLTESEGTRKEKKYGGLSEREHIIKSFKANQYKALLAIKCLDEGIDIPTASIGILMASSTNPREYVQRIGRIIRQSEGKTFASLFDICVGKISGLEEEELELEKKIRKKESIRLSDIAENSINSADALKVIMNLNY